MNDFKLEYNIDDEYKQLYNDLVKFVTILVVLNLIMYISNPTQNVLLGSNYIKLMTSIVLGITTYWLVISKIIVFD
jgi:hypothetical protein|tara:strand:- start:1737 stop:1964 length:228 start_codon:yes stop_codon:yes gene_type:complete